MAIEFDCVARTDRDKEAAKRLAERLGFEKGIPTQLAEEIFIAGMNYKDDTSTNNIIFNQAGLKRGVLLYGKPGPGKTEGEKNGNRN